MKKTIKSAGLRFNQGTRRIKILLIIYFFPIIGLPSNLLAAPIFTSTFGSQGTGNGQFNSPQYLAINPVGNLYVTDTGNHRVQVFDPLGNPLAKFGGLGNGGGLFDSPVGIAFGPTGDIYVTDGNYNGTADSRVQIFNPNGTFKSQFGTTGPLNGEFNDPEAIDIGPGGKVHVADFNNARVQVFDSAGGFISTFGTLGTADGQFNGPEGVTVDGTGKIYVT